MQALAVHRDATVTVELFSLRRRRLVHGPAVGSLLVLLAAVPPEARGQAGSQRARGALLARCPWDLCSGVWGLGRREVPHHSPLPRYPPFFFLSVLAPPLACTESTSRAEGLSGLRDRCTRSMYVHGMNGASNDFHFSQSTLLNYSHMCAGIYTRISSIIGNKKKMKTNQRCLNRRLFK